jgi:hypothetical protein
VVVDVALTDVPVADVIDVLVCVLVVCVLVVCVPVVCVPVVCVPVVVVVTSHSGHPAHQEAYGRNEHFRCHEYGWLAHTEV